MIDVEAEVRKLLGTLAGVTAAFGTRVYFGRSLPPGYRVEQGAALLGMLRGGGQEYHSKLWRASVQFRCYAASESAARAAARALYDDLNDTQARGMAYIRMEDGTLPTLLNEPGTNWPYVLSYFVFQAQDL